MSCQSHTEHRPGAVAIRLPAAPHRPSAILNLQERNCKMKTVSHCRDYPALAQCSHAPAWADLQRRPGCPQPAAGD